MPEYVAASTVNQSINEALPTIKPPEKPNYIASAAIVIVGVALVISLAVPLATRVNTARA